MRLAEMHHDKVITKGIGWQREDLVYSTACKLLTLIKALIMRWRPLTFSCVF